jgi:DNA-binding LytR/AlgR family response regulator
MLNVAVCDDCETQLEVVVALLKKYQAERPGIEMTPQSFTSGREVLKSMSLGNTFDLLLLDILMPELDGIELAREIRKQNQDVKIVFLTSSTDHALDAFEVSATQYVIKPPRADALFPILDRALQEPPLKPEQYFTLAMPERIVKLPFASIVCVDIQGRRMRVFLENGEVLTGKYLRQPFDMAIAPLLLDDRFFHTHKSFVVNLTHATELTGNSFIMKDNIMVPISRRIYVEAKRRYNEKI